MKYDIWSKYYQFGEDTESFKAVSARGADEITIEVILILFLKAQFRLDLSRSS